MAGLVRWNPAHDAVVFAVLTIFDVLTASQRLQMSKTQPTLADLALPDSVSVMERCPAFRLRAARVEQLAAGFSRTSRFNN